MKTSGQRELGLELPSSLENPEGFSVADSHQTLAVRGIDQLPKLSATSTHQLPDTWRELPTFAVVRSGVPLNGGNVDDHDGLPQTTSGTTMSARC